MSEVAKIEQPKGHSLMQIIERAVTSNDIDVDKLDKLLTVQERWEANQARMEYNQAMARFREKVPTIAKNRAGHNSRYAGLAETIEQIKPLMCDCGLSHSWRTDQDERRVKVSCIITHTGGHSEVTSLSAEPDTSGNKNGIQAIASAVSYLERYTLFALLGLASADMDDDGYKAGAASITDEQMADLIALMDEIGDDLDRKKFAEYLKSKGVREGKVENIPASMYRDVVRMVERKRS